MVLMISPLVTLSCRAMHIKLLGGDRMNQKFSDEVILALIKALGDIALALIKR